MLHLYWREHSCSGRRSSRVKECQETKGKSNEEAEVSSLWRWTGTLDTGIIYNEIPYSTMKRSKLKRTVFVLNSLRNQFNFPLWSLTNSCSSKTDFVLKSHPQPKRKESVKESPSATFIQQGKSFDASHSIKNVDGFALSCILWAKDSKTLWRT